MGNCRSSERRVIVVVNGSSQVVTNIYGHYRAIVRVSKNEAKNKEYFAATQTWNVDLCNENNCFEDSCQTVYLGNNRRGLAARGSNATCQGYILTACFPQSRLSCSTAPFILQDFLACLMSPGKGLANCCYCQAMPIFIILSNF